MICSFRNIECDGGAQASIERSIDLDRDMIATPSFGAWYAVGLKKVV